MRALLDTRLAESRFVVATTWGAGALWVGALLLAGWQLLANRGEPNEWCLLAALMGVSAVVMALTGAVVRTVRIEHELTRVLASAMAAETKTATQELRDLLLRDLQGGALPSQRRG